MRYHINLTNVWGNMVLSARQVETIKAPGRYADDRGLYLQVRPSGAKSWMFRFQLNRKRHDVGFGSYPDVSLLDARDKREDAKRLIGRGINPITRQQKAGDVPTFIEAAAAYITNHAPIWSNPKHTQQWSNTLATYAYPVIGKIPVDEITTADMLEILTPIWIAKQETAKRVRGRIESILAATFIAHNLPTGNNPARLKNHLEHALPKKRVEVKHHESMPYTDVPEFMADLMHRQGVAARALEFTILTAARTGEVIGARWDEIEGDIWTIPAARYKTRKAHSIPLIPEALTLLKTIPRDSQYIFAIKDNPISNMSMAAVLKRMKIAVTVHGFRASFRNWSAESLNYPNEVLEAALGHVVQGKAERAYRRATFLDQRIQLMSDWAGFLACAFKRPDLKVVK